MPMTAERRMAALRYARTKGIIGTMGGIPQRMGMMKGTKYARDKRYMGVRTYVGIA